MSTSTTTVDSCEHVVTSPSMSDGNSLIPRRRTPLNTPSVRTMAGKISGKTPHGMKRIRKTAYRAFKSDPTVARAMARTKKCFLCSIVFSSICKKITEHDHHTGSFRGVTCGSCNTHDGKAVKSARQQHYVKKQDYEAGKPMPPGFFETYAKELSSRLGIDLEVCREYITGKRWQRFRTFF